MADYYPNDINDYILIDPFDGAAANLNLRVPEYIRPDVSISGVWTDSDIANAIRVGDTQGLLEPGATTSSHAVGGIDLGISSVSMQVVFELAGATDLIKVFVRADSNTTLEANDPAYNGVRIHLDVNGTAYSTKCVEITGGSAADLTDTDGNLGLLDHFDGGDATNVASAIIVDTGSAISLSIGGTTRTWDTTWQNDATRIGFGFDATSTSNVHSVRAW